MLVNKHFYILIVSLTVLSCSSVNNTQGDKQIQNKESMATNNTMSGQLVKKEFTNKIGEGNGIYEYYFRASIQDYFIKFCESKVAKAEIEALNLSEFDTFTVEAEIVEGEWDICPDDPAEMQSRIGKYLRIIKVID